MSPNYKSGQPDYGRPFQQKAKSFLSTQLLTSNFSICLNWVFIPAGSLLFIQAYLFMSWRSPDPALTCKCDIVLCLYSLAPGFNYNWWAGPEGMSQPLGTGRVWRVHTEWQGDTALPYCIYILCPLCTIPCLSDRQVTPGSGVRTQGGNEGEVGTWRPKIYFLLGS